MYYINDQSMKEILHFLRELEDLVGIEDPNEKLSRLIKNLVGLNKVDRTEVLRYRLKIMEEWSKIESELKFMPILIEDYKFLNDNCGVDWDRNLIEENEPLIRRIEEIDGLYKDMVKRLEEVSK